MAFTFFPVVGYAGLRFGPAGASTLVALVAAFAMSVIWLAAWTVQFVPAGADDLLLHLFCFCAG